MASEQSSLSTGSDTSRQNAGHDGRERIVMFVDVRDTAATKARQEDPNPFIDQVRRHNQHVVAEVGKLLGRLPQTSLTSPVDTLKFLGDGVMICLEANRTLAAGALWLADRVIHGWNDSMRAGIGIAAGPVAHHTDQDWPDPDIQGSAVDTAAGLVRIAKPNQILLDERITDLLELKRESDDKTMVPLDEIEESKYGTLAQPQQVHLRAFKQERKAYVFMGPSRPSKDPPQSILDPWSVLEQVGKIERDSREALAEMLEQVKLGFEYRGKNIPSHFHGRLEEMKANVGKPLYRLIEEHANYDANYDASNALRAASNDHDLLKQLREELTELESAYKSLSAARSTTDYRTAFSRVDTSLRSNLPREVGAIRQKLGLP